MDVIVGQVTALAEGASEATRKSILNALRDLSYKLESPDDTINRLWSGQVTIAVVRVGINLKIFEHLASSGKPLTMKELATLTNADQTLLARILRTLAGYGVIKENGINEFARTNISDTLSRPGDIAAIKHYFDICGPSYQELPAWLEKRGYKNPTDPNDTPYHSAFNTTQNLFEYMIEDGAAIENFNVYMTARRQNQKTWVHEYPMKDDIDLTNPNISPHGVLFVDVGGGVGHQAAEFRAAYPDLQGRVINQDIPTSIAQAETLPSAGIEHIVYDFNMPQPVKGAKYYYLRMVLHDWPDGKCITILQNQIGAMAEDSIILVDDMVVPNHGVPWQVAQFDIAMMAAGSAMERTEAQWDGLYEAVGLRVLRRVVYTPGVCEAVTALVRK
ncbi:O-methyltransferase [Lophiotrema nucula]|uniref:O-methyltransferase n=1 Tax=Lophiotrema nucula TaxID=690887 RepID=A0A6A5YMN5_9PLEO|nr:O-methyltransferase [Lophiotrema nucula]